MNVTGTIRNHVPKLMNIPGTTMNQEPNALKSIGHNPQTPILLLKRRPNYLQHEKSKGNDTYLEEDLKSDSGGSNQTANGTAVSAVL